MNRIRRELREDETGIKRKPNIISILMDAKGGIKDEQADYEIIKGRVKQIGKCIWGLLV